MSSKVKDKIINNQISKEAVEWLLRQIIVLPKSWLVINLIFIILSTIEITWGKDFSYKFAIKNTTAIFLTLMWLPAVLKIFALSGGVLKTPAGEFDSSGMINMLQSLSADSLGFLIEQTKLAEEVAPPEQQQEMRQIRQEWQRYYSSKIPVSDAKQLLEGLAQRYKDIRKSMPSGAQRTFEMESIAGRMRALAEIVNFPVSEVNTFLQSEDQGHRLLGLSIAEWSGKTIYFDLVLDLISNSKSAFEQTVGLRAMESMLYQLELQQKRKLKSVLIEQRDFNQKEKRWIKKDSNRWLISERLLSAMKI